MSEITVNLSVSVDQRCVEEAVSTFSSSLAKAVRVTVEQEPKPTLCICCCAERQPNGEMPCDH